MSKIISQILIVLLAIALVAGATYLIVQQTSATFSVPSDQPTFSGDGPQNGTGLHNGQGLGRGMRGEGGGEGSSGAWLDLLKNIGIVAAAAVLVTMIKWIFTRRPKIQPQITGN